MGMFKVLHCRNTPARVPSDAVGTPAFSSDATPLQPAEARRSSSAR